MACNRLPYSGNQLPVNKTEIFKYQGHIIDYHIQVMEYMSSKMKISSIRGMYPITTFR